MDELFPDLYILIDLFGMGVALWLGMHLLVHGWGWHRSRAPMAGWGLLGAALPPAVAAYAAIAAPPIGVGRLALLKALIVPALPLTLLLVRRFAPGILAIRDRLSLGVTGLAALFTIALIVLLGPLRPELAARQSDALVAMVLTTLLALGAVLRHVVRARQLLRSPPERSALLLIAFSAVLAALGSLILAADLTLSLDGPQLQGSLARLGLTPPLGGHLLRLAGSLLRALAVVGMAIGIVRQARAEAAPHLARLAHATLVTVSLLLLYLVVGGWVVWYFALPRWLMGLFMLLALVTDALDDGARALMEGFLYRGESATTRRTLRHLAEHLAPQDETPPALRALLVRLARQLGSPQLAYAARKDLKEGKREYQIVAAVRPAWLGKKVEAAHPDEWEERAGGGWTFPVQRHRQSIGMLVSEETGTLSPVQTQLLKEAAAEIVLLLEEWGSTAEKRTRLNEALTAYRTHSDSVAERLRTLATPPPAPPDLRRAVDQFLTRYSEEASALGTLPLARLNAVTRVIPPAQAGSAEARGNAARIIVQHLVEQLRPLAVELPTTPDDLWLPYLALTRLHIHNQPRDEFMKEYNLPGRRVRRARQRGIEQVARHLGEMEAAMRRHAPAPDSAPTSAPSGSPLGGSLPAPTSAAPTAALPKPAFAARFGRKRDEGTDPAPGSAPAAAPGPKPSAESKPSGFTLPFGRKANSEGSESAEPKKSGLTMPFGRKASSEGSESAEPKKGGLTMPFGRKASSEGSESAEPKKGGLTMPFGRKASSEAGEGAEPKKSGLPSFGRKASSEAGEGAEPKKSGLPSFGRKPPPSSDAPTSVTSAAAEPPKSLKERFGGMAGGVTGRLKRGGEASESTATRPPPATLPTGSRARPVPKPSPSTPPPPPSDEGETFDENPF